MANKGNPNHAPAGAPNGTGGQFTSGPQAGGEQGQEQKQTTAKAKKTTKGKAKPQFKKVKPTLLAPDALAQMFAKLQDINQGINVPLLNDAQDIEQNVEKFFSQQVIGHLSREWDIGHGYIHPKAKQNVSLNLFTCVFGKYRYKDNHAHLITMDEFNKMAAQPDKFRKVYRGFTSEGEARANILKGYLTPDINNLTIYGNGVYGTNVYTSTDYQYSLGWYANYDDSKVLYSLVDRDAKKIDENKLRNIQQQFLTGRQYDWKTNSYTDNAVSASIKQKVTNHLMNNGIDPEKSKKMSQKFVDTLASDMSLVAILLGYDYQVCSGGKQRNILNLDKWYIAKRW